MHAGGDTKSKGDAKELRDVDVSQTQTLSCELLLITDIRHVFHLTLG